MTAETLKQANTLPLVSCILPTADRSHYIPMAIRLFLDQNYDGAELVIVDDGNRSVIDFIPEHPRIKYHFLSKKVSVGEKRNICCDLAQGRIILHWDDDDWFANWRISYQIAHLLNSGKQICGINRMYYANPKTYKAWIYAFPEKLGSWIAGGSFCYYKSLWESREFSPVNDGEDTRFINSVADDHIHILERYDFYVGRVHNMNTSIKKTEESVWHNLPISVIESIVGKDFTLWSIQPD